MKRVFRARRTAQLPRKIVHPTGAAREDVVGSRELQTQGHVVDPVATSEVNNVTHVHEFVTPQSGPVFTAGGTRHCLRQWSGLTSDPFILKSIMGVTLDFDTRPHQMFVPKPLPFSKVETDAIDVEIADFLDKGIFEKAYHSEPEFISNVFTREKRDGSRRVILNVSALNPFIEYHHFKMDTIETVIGLMRYNCYMASLDLSNAYFSVPVATSDRCYLKFKWKKELDQFLVLPNGLTSAPGFSRRF